MGDTPQWKMRISHLDPSTQETYSRICRRHGVSDDTTWADISKHVEKIRNPDIKRSVIGALITCLGTKEGAQVKKDFRDINLKLDNHIDWHMDQ